jgi:hypothetical protein
MTLISELVNEHQALFSGAARSTPEVLLGVEQSLEVRLPDDVFWFLTSCGVADTRAVSSDRALVFDTIRYRKAVNLPKHFVVLDERNDAGTVFLDTSSESGPVIWVDAHAVGAFALGTIRPTECDTYPNFCEWVAECIREIED